MYHIIYALCVINFCLTHPYKMIFYRWNVKNNNISQIKRFYLNFGVEQQRLSGTNDQRLCNAIFSRAVDQ